MVSRNQYSDARTSSERVGDGTQSCGARAGAPDGGEAHDAEQAFYEHTFRRAAGKYAPMPPWKAIALRLWEHCEWRSPVVGRALRDGSSHGFTIRLQRSKNDNYVSKALVDIILDAFWPNCAACCLLVSYR